MFSLKIEEVFKDVVNIFVNTIMYFVTVLYLFIVT